MADDTAVEDHRVNKSEELGPAAKVRTTTLQPKADNGTKKRGKVEPTEAQRAVQAAKEREPERRSALVDEPERKRKVPPPAWTKPHAAVAARQIELPPLLSPSPPAPHPLVDDAWCGLCGGALYRGPSVSCADGHVRPAHVGWEDAVEILLRASISASEIAARMVTDQHDVEAFITERAPERAQVQLEPPASQAPIDQLRRLEERITEIDAEMARMREQRPFRTLRDWQRDVHANARAKGFYAAVPDPSDPIWVAARLALIHSEISEALEALRERGLASTVGEGGKPEGFGSELADATIRILDLAESLGIDLEEVITKKHAYNTSRSHRHGGSRYYNALVEIERDRQERFAAIRRVHAPDP